MLTPEAIVNKVARRDTDRLSFDPTLVRTDFPVLARQVHGVPLVYLDNAATTQKPQSVIDAISAYYAKNNANVHRGIHTLAEEATTAYETTRARVAQWLGGVDSREVVFTRGTTESINLVASAWGGANLRKGDRIVLTQMEHHANLVPWLQVAEKTGAFIDYIPITSEGLLDLEAAEKLLKQEGVKLLALTHMSNVLGTINPVQQLIAIAKSNGIVTLVDGAQAVPHLPVSIRELDADFYAVSAHKMLGPTGVGVLYGRAEWLEKMEPYQTGGEMIRLVTYEKATWSDLPHKFEAGTPNIAGVVAFKAALDYLDSLGMEVVREHERRLTAATLSALEEIPWVTVFGPKNADIHGGAISFEVEDVHPHDLAQFLDQEGIAVRAGHHCAQPLTKLLGRMSTTRASFYIYNTVDEVERLLEAIHKARRYFVGK